MARCDKGVTFVHGVARAALSVASPAASVGRVRQPRNLLPPAGIYHVTTRGVARTAIFLNDDERRLFLRLFAAEVRPPRLALPRLLPDDDPLPPRRRDRALAPLRRHAAPERHLRADVQPPPPPQRPPLRRPLRRLAAERRAPPPPDLRVRAPEPGPRGPLRRAPATGPGRPPEQPKANTCSRPPARLNWLGYGPGRAGRPRRARAQPQGHHVRLPRHALICVTGLSGSGKSSLAFDTIYAEGQRRYVESLSRLRAPVPADDGEAGRRLDRRPLAGDLDRPEDDQPQPALDRRHRHRDLRLPAPALRAHRPAALPDLRAADRRPEPGGDRRPDPAARPRARSSRSTRRSSATARASTRTSSRSSAQRGSRA